jgi:hypothetical protein
MGGERNKFQDKRHQEAKAALQDSGQDDLKHRTYRAVKIFGDLVLQSLFVYR